jgi:hypothetical protein
MTSESVCRMLGIQLTPMQAMACRYLEMFGYRFCVDFGYDNAVQKAEAHFRTRVPCMGVH